MTTMPKDFVEFLNTLASNRVEFLLIGGWAVARHGRPRATQDLDVWIARSPENASRVADALREFGFAPEPDTLDRLLAPGTILRMGVPPMRIEILTTISGVEFSECAPRAIELDLGDRIVKVIGLEDLLANKRASGRLKDLADVAALEGRE